MEQLYLNFPIKAAYLPEDYVVSSANISAFSCIKNWPNWGKGIFPKILLLYGEYGSGKTHLAHIWQHISNAIFLKAQDLYSLHLFTGQQNLICDNIENIDETLLFHLINFTHENQQYLLMTSQFSPEKLKISLPDLRSRILALNAMGINPPTDDLLEAVLLKHLTDRQLKVNSQCLDFIISRIDRSFSKLLEFINMLDKESAISKRAITIPLLKKVLEKTK